MALQSANGCHNRPDHPVKYVACPKYSKGTLWPVYQANTTVGPCFLKPISTLPPQEGDCTETQIA
jgi:hypothetical protein